MTMERNKRGIPPYHEPVYADEEQTYRQLAVTQLSRRCWKKSLDRLEDLRRAIRSS